GSTCPSKTRLVDAVTPCANNPVRESLLAPGFPRQYGAIDTGATLRHPAVLSEEHSPVGLFALSWRTPGRVSPTPPTRTGGLEMTECGSPVREAWQLTVIQLLPTSACIFHRRGLRVRRFAPCRNAAGIVGYFTMRWQHGSDHITVPYRPKSGALHCRMVDFCPFEESHRRPLWWVPGTTIEKVNDEKTGMRQCLFPSCLLE
ncbi:hypothetical protein TcCL_ESM06501, partial [Trypanosoma cruzi]